MIYKITIFFNRKKIVKFVILKLKKNRKIRILDLWQIVWFSTRLGR